MGGVIIALEKGPKREVASGSGGEGSTVLRDEEKPDFGDDDERMDVGGSARMMAAEKLADCFGVPEKAKEIDRYLSDWMDNYSG